MQMMTCICRVGTGLDYFHKIKAVCQQNSSCLFPIFLQMRTFADELYNIAIDKVIGNEKMAH